MESIFKHRFFITLRITGIEPARVTPSDSKSDASTGSAISAEEAAELLCRIKRKLL